MVDTNYFLGIVKILENPRILSLKTNIFVTTFRVEIPQFRKNKIIRLVIWGNLGQNVTKYYKTSDYIFVEGYISNQIKKKQRDKKLKIVTLTVFKIYPFCLNPNQTIHRF